MLKTLVCVHHHHHHTMPFGNRPGGGDGAW